MSVTTGKQVNLPVITKNADSLLFRFRKQKATKITGKASEKNHFLRIDLNECKMLNCMHGKHEIKLFLKKEKNSRLLFFWKGI
jgi:phosphatidate phosphatase PAH1